MKNKDYHDIQEAYSLIKKDFPDRPLVSIYDIGGEWYFGFARAPLPEGVTGAPFAYVMNKSTGDYEKRNILFEPGIFKGKENLAYKVTDKKK